MPLCGRIRLNLVKLKVFYFLFYGGVGAVIPYIPVYLKQTGLTASETGVIFGILPFVSCTSKPFLGGLVDKYKLHKPVFLIFCLLAGLAHTSLLLVPGKDTSDYKGNISDFLTTNMIWDKEKVLPTCYLPVAYLDFCLDGGLANISWAFGTNYSSTTKTDPILHNIMYCVPRDPPYELFVTPTNTPAFSRRKSDLKQEIVLKLTEVFFSAQHETRCTVKVQNITYFQLPSTTYMCQSHSRYSCYQKSSVNKSFLDQQPETVAEFMAPFWFSFMILNIARLLHDTVMSFTDAVTFSYLEDDRAQFGIQRLFGSIGFVVVSVPVSVLLHFYARRGDSTDFSLAFYIYLTCSCLSAFTSAFMTISFKQKANNLCAAFCRLLKDQEIVIMLLVTTFSGAQIGVMEGFCFWYLEQIGASQLILGLCVGIALCSEILFFFVSSTIVRRLGEIRTLQISLLAAAARVVILSFVTSPWYGLAVQLFHGPAFSLMWVASPAYVSSIAPCGMAVTSQIILGSLVYGLGYGTGSLVTGVVYDAIGAAWTFRMNGAVTLVVLVLFAAVHGCYLKQKTQEKTETCDKHEPVTGILLADMPSVKPT